MPDLWSIKRTCYSGHKQKYNFVVIYFISWFIWLCIMVVRNSEHGIGNNNSVDFHRRRCSFYWLQTLVYWELYSHLFVGHGFLKFKSSNSSSEHWDFFSNKVHWKCFLTIFSTFSVDAMQYGDIYQWWINSIPFESWEC